MPQYIDERKHLLKNLKKGIALITAASLSFLMAGCSTGSTGNTSSTVSYKSSITLSTTTSVNDSGLLDYLKPNFEADTGIELKIVAQGTGQALKTAANGDADVVLVHDKAQEETFVSQGNGLKRIEFMYNYFVIVGPSSDPAGIKSAKSASDAFKKIAAKQSTFISRGDSSGTNSKELKLWTSAGVTSSSSNSPVGSWYISAGKGMGDTLTMTSEDQAYTLTDKATYLSMKSNLNLDILLEDSADLMNQYTLIAVNPDNHTGINSEGAQEFINWMVSQKGLDLISQYGVSQYGEAMFTINYKG